MTMRIRRPGPFAPAGAVLAALLLAGCATTPGGGTPAEAVAERAKARWEAVLAGKADQAYTYFSPGYRSTVSLSAYRQRLSVQRVQWTAAEFRGVSCEEQLCKPAFSVTYRYNMPVRGVGEVENTRVVTEEWIRADGEWFYVPPDLARKGLR